MQIAPHTLGSVARAFAVSPKEQHQDPTASADKARKTAGTASGTPHGQPTAKPLAHVGAAAPKTIATVSPVADPSSLAPPGSTPAPSAAPPVAVSHPQPPIFDPNHKPMLTAQEVAKLAQSVISDVRPDHADEIIERLPREIVGEIFKTNDVDGEAGLSFEELGVGKGGFNNTDTDRNGTVDHHELYDRIQAMLTNAYRRNPNLNVGQFVQNMLDKFSTSPTTGDTLAMTAADGAINGESDGTTGSIPATAAEADISGDTATEGMPLTAQEAAKSMADDVSSPVADGISATAASIAEKYETNAARISLSQYSDQIARALSDRLADRGFDSHPPLNIRAMVNELGFSPKRSDMIVQALQARYPNGLGMSVVG